MNFPFQHEKRKKLDIKNVYLIEPYRVSESTIKKLIPIPLIILIMHSNKVEKMHISDT